MPDVPMGLVIKVTGFLSSVRQMTRIRCLFGTVEYNPNDFDAGDVIDMIENRPPSSFCPTGFSKATTTEALYLLESMTKAG